MHWCVSCPGTATLKEFFDQELNEHEDDEKFHFFTTSSLWYLKQCDLKKEN